MIENTKFSIYFYLFNAIKNNFDYEATIDNFCAFAEEVVCATVKSEDNTREELERLTKKHPNFKVVDTKIDISTKNNRFDGQLKTAALKATTNPIKIIADADERFVLSQKPKWVKYAESLLINERIDGYLVPTLDLWGDESLIRSDQNIGVKFRMHKSTIHSRGVAPFAELRDGHFDVTQSDSTEPLNYNGDLGSFAQIVQPQNLMPLFCFTLKNEIYTLHYGYVDIKRRVEINKYWKPHWESRAGQKVSIILDESGLKNIKTMKHNLPLI